MKIFVTTKPGAKQTKIERLDETHFRVRVKAPAQEGKANQAVLEALAAYLEVPKSRLTLIRGHKSKHKTFSLD